MSNCTTQWQVKKARKSYTGIRSAKSLSFSMHLSFSQLALMTLWIHCKELVVQLLQQWDFWENLMAIQSRQANLESTKRQFQYSPISAHWDLCSWNASYFKLKHCLLSCLQTHQNNALQQSCNQECDTSPGLIALSIAGKLGVAF